MTTSSAVGARCNISRKTLLAVAVVTAAGAVVVAAYAKGRKKKKTAEDMTSSSSSTTLSDEQCNKSWSEQVEAEEVEGEHKSVTDVKEEETEELTAQLGELQVGSGGAAVSVRSLIPDILLISGMSRDAKRPVSVNCADDAPAKATDSGVVSPVGNGDAGDIDFVSKKQRSESSDSGGSSASVGSLIAGSSSSSSVLHNHSHNHNLQHGDGAFSDSGQGSEPDDGTIMCYQFKIPCYMTGKLIGQGGQFVKSLKAMSMCHINIEKNSNSRRRPDYWLPPQNGQPTEYQTVMLEGTRSQIDKCLDLIRERFHNCPEVSLEQTNPSTVSLLGAPNHFPTPQHALMSNNILPVFVSALESGTHIFVQQPTHYTFHHMHRLEQCMNHVYNSDNSKQYGDCSLSESELQESLVCVCRTEGKWYRIQLVSKAEDAEDAEKDSKKNGKWCCRFLDVGGYGWVEAGDLRKIRSDFMELPFQSIECCLANVVPRESVDEFAGAEALRDLTQDKNCFVRLSHFEEGSVPYVDLYYQVVENNEEPRHVLVNRELVNLGLMNWFETAGGPAALGTASVPLV